MQMRRMLAIRRRQATALAISPAPLMSTTGDIGSEPTAPEEATQDGIAAGIIVIEQSTKRPSCAAEAHGAESLPNKLIYCERRCNRISWFSGINLAMAP